MTALVGVLLMVFAAVVFSAVVAFLLGRGACGERDRAIQWVTKAEARGALSPEDAAGIKAEIRGDA